MSLELGLQFCVWPVFRHPCQNQSVANDPNAPPLKELGHFGYLQGRLDAEDVEEHETEVGGRLMLIHEAKPCFQSQSSTLKVLDPTEPPQGGKQVDPWKGECHPGDHTDVRENLDPQHKSPACEVVVDNTD